MLKSLLTYSNCLFFALRLYYRRRSKGRKGFVISRHSKYYPGPHFMYVRIRQTGEYQIVGYVPKYPVHRLFPPPMFDGKVQWGDDPTIL